MSDRFPLLLAIVPFIFKLHSYIQPTSCTQASNIVGHLPCSRHFSRYGQKHTCEPNKQTFLLCHYIHFPQSTQLGKQENTRCAVIPIWTLELPSKSGELWKFSLSRNDKGISGWEGEKKNKNRFLRIPEAMVER